MAGPAPRLARDDLFGRHLRSYAAEHSGQQIAILQAGCTTAEDLGVTALSAAGARLSISMIDEDNAVTRAAIAQHQHLAGAILADLRSVPLPPRAYDIVQCSGLLSRVEHADLVLDRLLAAVKPGGLLLLRTRDRDSAAGFLDRVLPGPALQAIWHKRQPGEPGPHLPVYERLASAPGSPDLWRVRPAFFSRLICPAWEALCCTWPWKLLYAELPSAVSRASRRSSGKASIA